MKPLQGKRILVTRPAAQADGLAAMITAQGGEALCFPLLEIGPPDDLQALDEVSENLDAYALAVFISPNAVVVFPQPDSPTKPSVSPCRSVNEMSSTA